MRSFASLTILGTLALTGAYAQSLSEHAAAAAGATIGTAAGKPLSNALGKVFGDVDKSTTTAAGAKAKAPAKATVTKPVPDSEKVSPVGTAEAPTPVAISGGGPSGGGSSSGGGAVASHAGGSRSSRRRPAAEAPLAPIAAPVAEPEPVVAAPPVKQLSAADISGLKVGATETDMLAALGVPESRVSIPDDDGHLRESCQYWAQGRQLGTVRLDNGQVVQVLVRNQ